MAQRPRARLAAPLVQPDHPAALQQRHECRRQVLWPLDVQVGGQTADSGLDLALVPVGAEEVVRPAEPGPYPEAGGQPVQGATHGGAAGVRGGRDEQLAERGLADQPSVGRAAQRRTTGEGQRVQAGLGVQPGDDLEQRPLEGPPSGGGQIRGPPELLTARLVPEGVCTAGLPTTWLGTAGLATARLGSPELPAARLLPESARVTEQLRPGGRDVHLVAAYVQVGQTQRVRVAVRGQLHHLGPVALAPRPRHLGQQRVEAAEPGGPGPVAVPELLGQALDPPARAPVVGGDLQQVLVRVERQLDLLDEVPDPAAPRVDHQPRRLLERRRVERAVDVGQVGGDHHDRRLVPEAEDLAGLLLVRARVLDLGVGGVALHDQVDPLLEQRHGGHVPVRQVAEAAPVVLAAADALLLQAVHARLAHRDGDGTILRTIYTDNNGKVSHRDAS